MNDERFRGHAERAKRGQWRLEDLPWDEPIEFGLGSKREQTITRLDMLDVATAMYHFQLGSRIRLGDHLVRSWSADEDLMECIEWHDIDDQRHVRGMRRLLGMLSHLGDPLPLAKARPGPSRMWRVTYSSHERLDATRLLLNMLIDEVVARTLCRFIAKGSWMPLMRAFFDACAEDEARHVSYLLPLVIDRLEHRSAAGIAVQQACAVAHVAHVQNAFRPYFRAFAGCSHNTVETIVSEVFRGVSVTLAELGPRWQDYPIVRLVHSADRSPWLLWLLR